MHLVHFADMTQVGGIERNLLQLIRETDRDGSIEHSLFADSYRVHAFFSNDIREHVRHYASVKHWGKLKIPKWPPALRAVHHDRTMAAWAPDMALLWHWFGDIVRLDICRRARIPAVYWERGLAWGTGGKHTEAFLNGLTGVLSNTYAGKRMLELRWGYAGATQVIPNTVIPRRPARECERHRTRSEAPFRLGTAGRLRSFKGVNLALHVLALLMRDGRDVSLDIAGDGPLLPQLGQLAERLGISERVHFLGLVDDMPGFFAGLDCYLHPALREPFGTVCAEAQAYGCPVLTSRVDGMPEVVLEARTGYCLPPQLGLERFADFDGDAVDVHDLVYDPENDCLREPGFVPPEAFAERVAAWMEQPQTYEQFSRAAVAHARERFALGSYLDRVHGALQRFGQCPPA